MEKTYLNTPYEERQEAKALGARWDAVHAKWYVPRSLDLTKFAKWLPAAAEQASPATDVALVQTGGMKLVEPGAKGISLSSLLAGVSHAVAQAYRAGVWTMLEVVELRINNGHVFLGVSERDAHGTVMAKASAVIWQSTARAILANFEQSSGAQLAPGIKLLVRAKPVFKPMHGFTLEIDAIDSDYTLGDLEARKRAIRERLTNEGVFAANKGVSPPWDFTDVMVVAPEGGAGLGDFQAQANRLEAFGVCQFTYVFSRFQGEGAAREICDALQSALVARSLSQAGLPDAVVIIRGGGAVNDMAWLNDYDLARLVCDLPLPVLTGIGHERDSTVIDEVAHFKFDTPSKVIAGIEQLIAKRVSQSRANFEFITHHASASVQSAMASASALEMTVTQQAHRHLARGKQATMELMSAIRIGSVQGVRAGAESAAERLQQVKMAAGAQLEVARRNVPSYWNQVTLGVAHSIRAGAVQADTLLGRVMDLSQRSVSGARQKVYENLETVSLSVRRLVREGANRSEAMMREIAGQGPEKTLSRGFALVRACDGRPVTRAAQVGEGALIEIQFQDGKLLATSDKHI